MQYYFLFNSQTKRLQLCSYQDTVEVIEDVEAQDDADALRVIEEGVACGVITDVSEPDRSTVGDITITKWYVQINPASV